MVDEDSNSTVSGPMKFIQQIYCHIVKFLQDKYWYWCVVLHACTNILRNLTVLVQFAYFGITPNKGREEQSGRFLFFFWPTFEQRSSQKATFEQLFGKYRASCVKPYTHCSIVHLKMNISFLQLPAFFLLFSLQLHHLPFHLLTTTDTLHKYLLHLIFRDGMGRLLLSRCNCI